MVGSELFFLNPPFCFNKFTITVLFQIVLAALMAIAAAELVVGPNARTTITGPDGSQIVADDYSGSVLNSKLVYTAPSVPYARYVPYPLISPSYYPYYSRYVHLV